jgi:transportin-1
MLIRDGDKDVRKSACEGIVLLMPKHFLVLLPHLEGLILLFAEATQDQNEALSLAASTFWIALLRMTKKHPEVSPVLQTHLPRIIPMLITCMVLSEEEIATMHADMGADDSVADRPEDMAPSFHKDSGGRHGGAGTCDVCCVTCVVCRLCCVT